MRKPSVSQLAAEFSTKLNAWLGGKTIAKINNENKRRAAGGDFDTCATHDFCDPNVAMLEVFEAHGLDPLDNDAELTNLVWDLAKKNQFRNNKKSK